MATKNISLLGKGASYRPVAYRSVVPFSCTLYGSCPSTMATIATYKVPKVENENNVSLKRPIEAIANPWGTRNITQKVHQTEKPLRKHSARHRSKPSRSPLW